MNLESVTVRHIEPIGSVIVVDLHAVKQKSDGVPVFALTVAECAHELVELGTLLDLEEDLVIIVCDFDIEVLASRLRRRTVGGLLMVRHLGGKSVDESLERPEWGG